MRGGRGGSGGGSREGPRESTVGVTGRGAEGARLLDEQRAARVALARVLAVSDGADHRVGEPPRVPAGFTLGVGEQLEVDGFQHVGGRATIGSAAPPRRGGSRIGIAVAAVVERGHGDGVGAADRLQQEAQTSTCERAVKVGQVEGEGGGRRRLFARACEGVVCTFDRRSSAMSFFNVLSL